MKSYIGLTARYLKVQKKRSILAIIGIILSVALITGIGTLFLSFQHSLLKDEIEENGSYHAIINDVDGKKAAEIKNHLNVSECTYYKETGFAVFDRSDSKNGQPPVRYYQIKALSKGAEGMLPIFMGEGRLPSAPGEIVVDYWSLQYLPEGVKLGDTIELETGKRFDKTGAEIKKDIVYAEGEAFKSDGKVKFKLVGFLKPKYIINRYISHAIIYLDDSKLDKDTTYNAILKVKSENKVRKQVETLLSDMNIDNSNKDKEKVVYNEKVLRLMGESANKNINDSMFYILGVIMLLVIISTIAVIYNTFNISVVERISQFGLLRCVGSTPMQVMKTVLTEALILGTIGIPVGIVTGTIAMGILFDIIKRITPGVKFATLDLTTSPYIVLLGIILGYITVFISVLLPALNAARVSPMDAVRNNKSYKKESFRKSRLFSFYKLLGVEGWIAGKNIRRNRKRFYITVFSMVISIVLFIVFGSFVDFYMRSGLSDRAENPSYSLNKILVNTPVQLTDEEYTRLSTIKGVKNVFKFGNSDINVIIPEKKLNNRIYTITGSAKKLDKNGNVILSNSNIICYGDNTLNVLQTYMKSGKISVKDFEDGKSVIAVTSSMIYDSKNSRSVILDAAYLNAGDEITIKTVTNEEKDIKERKLKISAILDYGILGQQRNTSGGIFVIVSEKLYKELLLEDNYPQEVMIQMDQNADTSEMKAFLDDFVAKNPDYQYLDYAQLAKDFKAQWLVICIFVYGFTAVISLIGCLNIINSISTNILLRTRELSVMRAIGMTSNGIKMLVSLESIIYGVVAAFLGAIVGSFISKLLYNSVRSVRDFNWVLPVKFILIGLAATILISIIAGFIPLKRINNGVIIEGIRGEE
jgi:ABC-type transport system, involved in lipoprotein release, permease component